MKTKILLITKLLSKHISLNIFIIPLLFSLTTVSSFAQTETCVPIGPLGTEQFGEFPFSTGHNSSYLQQIFTAAELKEGDIENGDVLTGISFNYFWETPTKRPIKIYLANTNLDSFNDNEWISLNEFESVFSSDCLEFSKGDDNWTRITFASPFEYTGGNIIVATLMNKVDTIDATNCFTEQKTERRLYTHQTVTNKSIYNRVFNDTPIKFNEISGLPITGETPLEGNAWKKRNNIRFCKIGAICPKVNNIFTTNITDSSISLDWLNGGNETSWIIEYGAVGFTQGEGTSIEVDTHPYEITGLSSQTRYDFYIRANCSAEEKSTWTGPKTVETKCGLITNSEILEGFNYQSTSLKCWTIIDANGDGNTENENGRWAFSFLGLARYTYSSSKKADDYLISPRIQLSENMGVTFEYKTYNINAIQKFSVKLITGATPEDYSNAIDIYTSEEINNTAYVKIPPINLSQHANEKVYIAIKCESEANSSYFDIDNFRVYTLSSENDITKFSLAEQTKDANIDYLEHKIQIEVGHQTDLTNLVPTIKVSEFATINPASGEARDFTNDVEYTVISENGKEQKWKVKVTKADGPSSYCDITEFTFPHIVGEAVITTTPPTVKAKIYFDKELSNIAPTIKISGFATINPPSGEAQDFSSGAVTYTVTAENSTTKVWTVTIENADSPPGATCENPILLNLSDLDSPHLIKGETTKGFGNIYNGTGMGDYDKGPDKLYKLSVSQNSMYDIKMYSIDTQYAGIAIFKGCPSENKMISFRRNSNSTDDIILKDLILAANTEYFLMVDNHAPNPDYITSYNLSFTKNSNPPCVNPKDLNITNITQNSVKINWNQSLDETAWELKYGVTGFHPDLAGNIINENVASPYELNGLTSNKEYDVYIRSICSDTEVMEWKDPVTFKTLEICQTPTNLTLSDFTSNSVKISWNGHNATNWIIEYKKSNETDFKIIETSTNPHTLSELQHSSKYTIRIKTKCQGEIESPVSEEVSFLTNCENISELPYFENFEDYGFDNANAFPLCWTRPITYSEYASKYPSIVESALDINTRCLMFKSEVNTPTIASTPIFSTDISNLILEFKLQRVKENSGKIILGTMTDNNDESTFTEFHTITPATSNVNDYRIDLKDYPSVTGTGKSIAFKHRSIDRQFTYYLDDVKVREIQTGNEIISFSTQNLLDVVIDPVHSTVKGTISKDSNLSQQTATITISEGASISPASGSTQNFTNDVTYTVTSESGAQKTWTVTLTKATVASSENKILSFEFPDQVGEAIFEDGTTNITAKLDWRKPLNSIVPTIQISKMASITPASGQAQDFTGEAGVTYTVNAEDGTTKNWNVKITHSDSPEGATCATPLNINLSDPNTSMTYAGETTEGFGNIYYNTQMEEYDNGCDKIYKLSVDQKSIYTITMYSISSNYAGIGLFKGCPSENNLLKKATNTLSKNDLILENIVLEADTEYFLMVDNDPSPDFIESYSLVFTKKDDPICLSPSDLKATNVLENSAVITWTQAFEENAWELKFGTPGFSVEDINAGTLLTENISSPYTLSGLATSTKYDIYIRSVCSDSKKGEWSELKFFETTVACPRPTGLKLDSQTTNSATISWDNNVTASEWILQYQKLGEATFKQVEVNTNPYTLENLETLTNYRLHLLAKCSETNTSQWSLALDFSTICDDIITIYPFEENFDHDSPSKGCWTIIDVNEDASLYGDGGKWGFNYGEVQYLFHATNAANDWLISPRFEIKEDSYLKFQYRVENEMFAEKFSVHIIKGETPKDYEISEVLLATQIVKNKDKLYINPISLKKYIGEKVYIGIKCESDPDMTSLWVDNFSIYQHVNKFKISSHDSQNGKIDPLGVTTVKEGESQTYKITPNVGYVINEVYVDQKKATAQLSDHTTYKTYTFNNVSEDHTITATFKLKSSEKFNLSASVEAEIGGSISPTSQIVNDGADFEFTITPAQGYILDNLKDNNVEKTDDVEDNKYKLTNIQENHTIVVKFKLDNSITEEAILDIKVYPNPTNDLLNIEVSDEISNIEILMLNGKLIHKQRVNDNRYQYQTSLLAEGNYLIKIYTENKVITKQFSVKR